MEILQIPVFFAFAYYFIKNFDNKLIKIFPILLLLFYLAVETLLFITSNELLFGRLDQTGYTHFGKNFEGSYADVIKYRDGRNVLYWLICKFYYENSFFFTPSLRFLNILFLMLSVVFFHKSLKVFLSENYKPTLLVLFTYLPIFWYFSVYVLRDIIMVSIGSMALYCFSKIIYKKIKFSTIILMVFAIFVGTILREQLGMSFLLLFLSAYLFKYLYVNNFLLFVFCYYISAKLVDSLVPLRSIQYFIRGLESLLYFEEVPHHVVKMFGFSILYENVSPYVFLSRLVFIETIIVPVLFFIVIFLRRKDKLFKYAVHCLFAVYIVYYSIYNIFDDIPINVRSILPYFPFFLLFIFSSFIVEDKSTDMNPHPKGNAYRLKKDRIISENIHVSV